jgi:hypothetical protein
MFPGHTAPHVANILVHIPCGWVALATGIVALARPAPAEALG